MEWILISIVIAAAVGGGVNYLRGAGRRLVFPTMTLILVGVTAIVSIVGELVPEVLASLGRDGPALLSGQVWRLITPLVVQDGGWAGTVFNLVALMILGTLAETLYGKRVLVTVYVLAGFVSEIAGYTLLQNQGFAGNSVADLGLAALCLVTFAAVPRSMAGVLGIIGLAAGAVLVVTLNLHGVGFAVGAIAGIVLVVRDHRRRGAMAGPSPTDGAGVLRDRSVRHGTAT